MNCLINKQAEITKKEASYVNPMTREELKAKEKNLGETGTNRVSYTMGWVTVHGESTQIKMRWDPSNEPAMMTYWAETGKLSKEEDNKESAVSLNVKIN